MSTGDLYSFREYDPAIFDRIFLFSSNYGCSIEQYNEFKYLPRSAEPGVNTHPLPAPATGLGRRGYGSPHIAVENKSRNPLTGGVGLCSSSSLCCPADCGTALLVTTGSSGR